MTIQFRTGHGPRRIETLYDGGTVAGMSDAELLDRFAQGRGEAAGAAFAALLSRHGPLVLGACRRALNDPHDVEDAFQAVFLILVRRAGSIRVGDTLGRWLYGVSRRVASRARTVASRRPMTAGDAAGRWADPRVGVEVGELRAALDDEIARLPRLYREAILLCDVEGLPLKEAATRVGRPIGTVASRLGRGRARLREQLTRRGHGPEAPTLGAWLDAGRARPAPPKWLVGATAKLAAIDAVGPVPTAIAALSRPILRMILVNKIRAIAAAILAVGILAAGASATRAPAVTVGPDDTPKPAKSVRTPVEEYEALVREFVETNARHDADLARLKSPTERRAYLEANQGWPLPNKFVGRFLALARAHPGDPGAFDALAWVAIKGYSSSAAEEAAAILARSHGEDPRLWSLCSEMTRGVLYPARGILLRAVIERNPDRPTRGRACLALGDYLADQAGFVRLLRTPGIQPWGAQFFTEGRQAEFRAFDADVAIREAESSYQRVLTEYADIRPTHLIPTGAITHDVRTVFDSRQVAEDDKGSLADLARPRLDALRTLDVGKPAPEIAGDDVDGRPMALGEFRGKVVLLTFSGDWCGPCVAMYPHEREIVAKFRGRPFSMVSVSSDPTREQLRKSIDSGDVTWRCWWEPRGEANGPIATRWHVTGWPTVYLIDHRGTIRVKFVGFVGQGQEGQPPIDAAIEAMVKEAEAR